MSANPINNAQAFSDAASEHWELLGRDLRGDVESFNRDHGGSASFGEAGPTEYRVQNPASGLEARITADTEDHIVRYEFVRMNDNSAGAPEGGILSIRLGREGVEFYSADQPLTTAEARSLLLDPLLDVPNR